LCTISYKNTDQTGRWWHWTSWRQGNEGLESRSRFFFHKTILSAFKSRCRTKFTSSILRAITMRTTLAGGGGGYVSGWLEGFWWKKLRDSSLTMGG
jgi:hypothetical protein